MEEDAFARKSDRRGKISDFRLTLMTNENLRINLTIRDSDKSFIYIPAGVDRVILLDAGELGREKKSQENRSTIMRASIDDGDRYLLFD